jgi:hypothetical protein
MGKKYKQSDIHIVASSKRNTGSCNGENMATILKGLLPTTGFKYLLLFAELYFFPTAQSNGEF